MDYGLIEIVMKAIVKHRANRPIRSGFVLGLGRRT